MDIQELIAQAASVGCVILPAPNAGCQYVESMAVNRGVYKDEDGKNQPRFKKEKKKFTKFYGEVWEAIGLRKALNPNEVYCLGLLFPYCEANSNFLMEKGLRPSPLALNDISKIINREERQTKRILKSLADKNMLAIVDSGGVMKYCVNPELFWNGGNMTEYWVFKTMFYTYQESLIKKAKEQLSANKANKAKSKNKDNLPHKILHVNGKKTSLVH